MAERWSAGAEKRGAERIMHHYVIQFRQLKPIPRDKWDFSTARNISKTGISFYASSDYPAGAELEIKLKNPITQHENRCWAKVVRVGSISSTKKKDLYEIAVHIEKIEEPKETFYKTIDFFIKRSHK